MKQVEKVLIGLLVITFMMSCRNKDEMNDSISSTDLTALQGMAVAYSEAKLYNDSITFCEDSIQQCTAEFISHCDEIFHNDVDAYNRHHSNYSHSNHGDDHHHANSKISMHNGKGTLSHNSESMQMMDNLLLDHAKYH